MIKKYTNRKQMVKMSFIDFDGTKLSRNEIVSHIKELGFKHFSFDVVATSHGVYGVNGAIVDVETTTDIPETITTFSILSRNTTLLEFV